MAEPAWVSSIRVTGAVAIEASAYGAPPEYAKTPRSGHTMLWSVRRTDRTGPTSQGACELNTAASRVIPPSTTSS